VRQDPDVILVGEIRDLETAKIAIQASLTGHLVLTTLHTNTAVGAIARLVDLGAERSSITSALTMSVGQRLVRKVCKECASQQKPSTQELAEIKKGLTGLPKEVEIPNLDTLQIAKASENGCATCNLTGYKGRKGLYEVFLIDKQLEQFILTNPSESAIQEMAIKGGMITMYQAGLIEVALGNTTFEELKKAVEADE